MLVDWPQSRIRRYFLWQTEYSIGLSRLEARAIFLVYSSILPFAWSLNVNGGRYGAAVTAVNTCRFYMLHDPDNYVHIRCRLKYSRFLLLRRDLGSGRSTRGCPVNLLVSLITAFSKSSSLITITIP